MTDSKGSETPQENAASVADVASGTSAKKTAQEKKTASGGTKKQATRKAPAKAATGTQAKRTGAAKDAATDTPAAPTKKEATATTAKASSAKKPSTRNAASGKKASTAEKNSVDGAGAQKSEAKNAGKKTTSSKGGSSNSAVKATKAPAPKSAAKEKAAKETAKAAPEKTSPAKKGQKPATAKTAAKTAPAVESAQASAAAPLAEGTKGTSASPAPEKAPRAARKTQAKAKTTRSGGSAGAKKSVPASEIAAEKRQDTQISPTEADLVSSLPPFYAPQNLAVSTQTEHGKAPAPFSVVPPEQGAPSAEGVAAPEKPSDEKSKDRRPSRPEQSTKEAAGRQIAEDATETDTADIAGEEGESAASADAPAGEKRRRSRGRGRRGRKKNGEETAVQAEDSATEVLEHDGDEAMDDDDAPSAKGQKTGKGKEDQEDTGKKGRRKMFVSVLPGEQVEVAIAEEGQVREYYVEMLHQAKTKGNIYKATIHNVDANLQAVFVSYGAAKNGFLQIDEIHPEYYNVPHDANKGRKYPPIQKVLKTGQELLVQVVKEPAGTKGAFLTTYLSLPGRYLVLTPGREQIGVSRKVEQDGERSRLREMLEGLSPGPGLGVIVRTVSMGASKTNLQRDLQYLKRLWKDVRKRGTEEKAPTLIYQEMDLTTRATRDYLTDDITEVWIDDAGTYDSLTDLAGVLFPRKQSLVRLHKDASMSLFERFNIQRQIDQIHSREVSLPSGGQLVIDPTEALTAIDINSGRSGGKSNFEDMAYRTNMEAAKMIPLQLRLRDIGGQVVADFIEMRDKAHWREVEKTLRAGMKEDRARYDVGKIGPFGMLEIVRQRLGSSAISISTEICPFCKGTGVRRNMEWRSQQALREIQRELRTALEEQRGEVSYAAEPDLALHLLNHKRERLMEMEKISGVRLEVVFKHNDI